jgi:hypothetical protein
MLKFCLRKKKPSRLKMINCYQVVSGKHYWESILPGRAKTSVAAEYNKVE